MEQKNYTSAGTFFLKVPPHHKNGGRHLPLYDSLTNNNISLTHFFVT